MVSLHIVTDSIAYNISSIIGPLGGTYERLCRDGGAVLAIHVSARLSSTVHTALMAAASLPDLPIRVMDSQQLSMGLGWQVIMAARAAQRGLDLDDVCHEVTKITRQVRAVAAPPSLWYVQRGGRIGKATA